ncbi:MAG: hypothetical protein GY719_19545 [bacterium]|nr:hypothetical protein [bacterium]
MAAYLRIAREPYEEPYHVNLIVAASNGRQSGELEIYANAEDLKRAANGLAGFPQPDVNVFLWELGSEQPADRFAFYFRFKVYQISPRGRCAVELRFNNNQASPDQEITEFCLLVDPGGLDRLANLLWEFAQLKHRVLEWTIHDGELR